MWQDRQDAHERAVALREGYEPDPLAMEPLSPPGRLTSDVREPGRIKPPPKGHRPEDQPLPVPTGGPSMHDKLIEMVLARKKLGLSRYGSLLQAHNGRDVLRDILEELVDACVYVLQAIEERDHPHS